MEKRWNYFQTMEDVMAKKLWVIIGLLFFLTAPFVSGLVKAEDKISDEQIKSLATKQMSSILKSIESKNYDGFSKDFSEKMKKAETPDKFAKLSEKLDQSLGKLLSFDYMGFYVQGPDTVTLFKAKFSKAKDDVFIRLVFDLKENSHEVTGLWLK